ncbi:hypothetical protein E8E13_010363 [Curvularia kusanoi]|uniref:Uncharacterized protein n=1 Tax=Curvularia kusanoi TaxID=90978 RepID=A0A9P4TLW3_CURKU|nr:hypothetical protein E8E13_010363 [Curvularia kusanoi]
MHHFHLPNPAMMVVSHQAPSEVKPELTSIKLPPLRQVTPDKSFSTCSSSVTNYDSDMSRRPSVSSISSSGFHPSRSASPAFSSTALETQYALSRPLDRLRVQDFPYPPTMLDASTLPLHTGGKASKKKREDRKQFSKRALAGTNCSKVRKSDNEAGNRYCQAIDMGDLARACKQSNPNIEQNAAPRNGSAGPWVMLKANNIAADVRQDGVEPSRWNKSSVNGSAILILDHSNAHFDDEINYVGNFITRVPNMSHDQIAEELLRYQRCLRASKETRGEADYILFSERMARQH